MNGMTVRRKLLIAFGSIVLVIVLVVLSTLGNFSRMDAANEATRETYEVIIDTQAMLEGLLRMETGARGYALAGRDGFLSSYRNGEEQFA
jgi:methyl-accepting chemotaxis protein